VSSPPAKCNSVDSPGFTKILCIKLNPYRIFFMKQKLGLSEREFACSKPIPNKNENVRTKIETNERNASQTFRRNASCGVHLLKVSVVFKHFSIILIISIAQ
jgi:hypothetical protein